MLNNVQRTELIKEISSLSIEKDEIKRIFKTLQKKADEACNIECDFIQTLEESQEKLAVMRENLRKCSLLKITVKGNNGEDLFGTIDEVFETDTFPDSLKSVYANSSIGYVSQFNYHPRNFFELHIDFSKPTLFDFSIQPSEKTPNNSSLKVEGYDSTWVNGVYSELGRLFLNKPMKYIHRGNIYDIILWVIGIPFSLWVCFKVSALVYDNIPNNIFLINAVFVYFFLFSLFFFRFLFHYFRWVYPRIEFKNKKGGSVTHKIILGSITISLLGKFAYDMIIWVWQAVF